jgi:hypothetical protein
MTENTPKMAEIDLNPEFRHALENSGKMVR